MSMSNEEHIEEILFEASAYGIRLEVMQLAAKLREDDTTIKKVDSFQIAYTQITQALEGDEYRSYIKRLKVYKRIV